jgi:hypothetical protein
LPDDGILHALGADTIAQKIRSGGILYPCQAIFLQTGTAQTLPRLTEYGIRENAGPFLIVEGCGVLINAEITRAEYAMLRSLAQVIQRLDASAPIRYLTEAEVGNVMKFGAGSYRELAEANQSMSSISA